MAEWTLCADLKVYADPHALAKPTGATVTRRTRI
ncbi:hypothetical protein FHU28_006168 [Micromonospora echinospora]|uniref:Uncharacterized protein n=1 Tax=Micromonospora echinospora TaxID=1877 RepID=A0ABR6MMK0_MICEC|nr:hypothetical protein [Micromonospora echinospora]